MSMSTEYKLSYTAAEIDAKLGSMVTQNEVDAAVAAAVPLDEMTAGEYVRVGQDGKLEGTSLPTASTGQRGVTYLVNSYTSTDTDKAATPNALNEVYQIASGKQDAITGTSGQFVMIGEDGKPTAVTLTNVAEVGA